MHIKKHEKSIQNSTLGNNNYNNHNEGNNKKQNLKPLVA